MKLWSRRPGSVRVHLVVVNEASGNILTDEWMWLGRNATVTVSVSGRLEWALTGVQVKDGEPERST